MNKNRKIIHIDMDAFYASVEQRDNPKLKGKPVIVGGSPNKRGVVATCSYEARKFGIHSAMSSTKAYNLCKHAIFLRPRFEAYKKVSQIIREIFHEYTDLVEPLSLDEAYLDVTENKKNIIFATIIAENIRKEIFKRTGLTASAGVSYNKFLAKVASDINKPNGIKVIIPDKASEFIDKLPIGKFYGVGKVTEKKMKEMNIYTGKDIKKISRYELIRLFGRAGDYYYKAANGIDDRQVCPASERNSIGAETTLDNDIIDNKEILRVLNKIAIRISNSLTKNKIKGKTIVLKVKYFDFKIITRSITAKEYISTNEQIMNYIELLLKRTDAGIKKIRLLGITVSNLDSNKKKSCYKQLILPIFFNELEDEEI